MTLASKSVAFDVTANIGELMADAEPFPLSRPQHEEVLEGAAGWQWVRDGLAASASADGHCRFVETIFLDHGYVVEWLHGRRAPEAKVLYRPRVLAASADLFRLLGPRRPAF